MSGNGTPGAAVSAPLTRSVVAPLTASAPAFTTGLAGLPNVPAFNSRTAGVTLLPGEADLLQAAAEFRRARMDLQRTQLDRMAVELPLPQLQLPYVVTSQLDRDHLDLLAGRMLERVGELPGAGAT